MTHAQRARLLLLALSPTIALGQGKPADSRAVCAGSWSPPFAIQRADGRPVYIERGVIAPIGNRTLMIGTPTFFWMRPDSVGPAKAEVMDTAEIRWSFTRAGALVDAAGTAEGVPRPDSARIRWNPSLLGSLNGAVSIVWQVSDSATPAHSAHPTAMRVEVASFDGARWTAPEAIIRGREVHFEALPAVRPTRTLDVVAAISTDSTGAVVRVARRGNGKWSTVDWHGGWLLSHVEALPTVDGSTVLVVLGSLGNATSALFTVRAEWSPQGVKWAQPVLVDSINYRYTYFSAAHLGGDSLVVVRSRAMNDGEHGGTMMTALSIDGGRTWQQVAPLALGTEITPRLVVDAAGRLHVVFRGSNRPGALNWPGGIMHSMWQSGAWTPPASISRNNSFTEPAAGIGAGGHLMVTWSEGVLSAGGIDPRSFASMWTAECAH